MNNPQVSVVIPVYNTEATLPRCLDSVLVQTYTDFEIVIVDDGSPDKAGEIADQYAAKYDFIRVIHKPNGGLAEARRSGLKASRGKYIVPLDSDDTLPECAIEILLNHCRQNNLDMAYGMFRRIVGKKEICNTHSRTGVLTGEEFLDYLLELDCRCGACYNMSRRDVWRDEVFPPSTHRFPSEDTYINIKLSRYLKNVGIYNDIVYNYYMNPQSLSIGGALFSTILWKDFFDAVRSELNDRGKLASKEDKIKIMEVNHLGFYVKHYDKQDPWYRQVLSYDCSRYGKKTRLLHFLLRWPKLLKFLITYNRRVKRLLS